MVFSIARGGDCLAVNGERAEEPKRDGPPGPEMLFKHGDVNNDGVISEDEIPADLPEPIKALLKAADKNQDKKVSAEEFAAAIKDHPLPPPPMGGTPMRGRGELGRMPDPKEVFQKWDTDKDGKLSLEEFTKGAEQLHKAMMGPAGGPRGPMQRGPMPGGPMQGCPMQGGPMQGGPMFGMGSHGGPGPGMMMGQPMPPSDGPKDVKALETRIQKLEDALKALEAKLSAK